MSIKIKSSKNINHSTNLKNKNCWRYLQASWFNSKLKFRDGRPNLFCPPCWHRISNPIQNHAFLNKTDEFFTQGFSSVFCFVFFFLHGFYSDGVCYTYYTIFTNFNWSKGHALNFSCVYYVLNSTIYRTSVVYILHLNNILSCDWNYSALLGLSTRY